LPHLVGIAEKFESEPVTVVSIDGGKRGEVAEGFLDESNVTHVVLNDEDRGVFRKYGVAGVPTTVIVDHAGRVMFRHVGFSPGMEERFVHEIETLLGWIEAA
jgi:peroxiredoxin